MQIYYSQQYRLKSVLLKIITAVIIIATSNIIVNITIKIFFLSIIQSSFTIYVFILQYFSFLINIIDFIIDFF